MYVGRGFTESGCVKWRMYTFVATIAVALFIVGGNSIAQAQTVAQQLGSLSVVQPFVGDANSTALFSSNWSKFSWASGKGIDTTSGWRVNPAYPTVDGAFYHATEYQATAGGAAASVTMAVNPAYQGRYFSLWLDAASDLGTMRTGYELRFTRAYFSNTYDVSLSKWQADIQTVLASQTNVGFVDGNSLAIVDQGDTVSAWTNTGSGFTQLLSANDSSLSEGYVGLSGAGNITKLTAYKAGQLIPPAPNLTSTSPPSPADENSPRIIGSAATNTTVKLFTNATCSGSPVASGGAAALASPGIQVSVADNTTTSFYATATDGLGNTSACSSPIGYIETSTAEGGVAGALDELAVVDPFATAENPLSGGGTWTRLAWASHAGQVAGTGTSGGWGPYNAYPTAHGAFRNQSTFEDEGGGVAVAATLSVSPLLADRYFSLWLDMPNPGSERTGYELRFTQTATSNSYNISLSRWQAGTKTELGSATGVSLPQQSSFALVDKGATVSAWADTGTGYTQLLSASDSAFDGGRVGIEGAGNYTRIRDLRAGALPAEIAAAVVDLGVVDPFDSAENPLSGGGAWTKLAWAGHAGQVAGSGTSGGWGPYNAYPTVHGAFWNQSAFSDTGEGVAVAATLSVTPSLADRHFSLWLDMADPENAGQTGYELRFKQTATANRYAVSLSKWEAGIETVLELAPSHDFPQQSSFALVDQGGTVSAWTDTGSGYDRLFSAADTAFDSGYVGLSGAGNFTRIRDLKAGTLREPSTAVPPQTTSSPHQASTSQTASASGIPARDFYGISSAGQIGSDAEAAAIQQLGVRKMRNNLGWARFETDNACDGTVDIPFSTAEYDAVVRRAADHNITIVGDLYGGRGGCPAHQFPNPGTQPYSDYALPGGFVSKVVRRYGVGGSFWENDYHGIDRPIRVWEVWNEPNLPINNPGGATVEPEKYARLLVDVAQAIRGAQVNNGYPASTAGTKILMGGLAPYNEAMPVDQFFNRMYANAGAAAGYTAQELHDAFDALSYHPYVLTSGPASTIREKVEFKINEARNVLATPRSALNGGSDAAKRLWLTELGWPVIPNAPSGYQVNEDRQRVYLKKVFRWIYNNSASLKIDYLAWYFFQDTGVPCTDVTGVNPACWDQVAGLRRSDGTTRPSWCAFSYRIGTNVCSEPAEFDTQTFSTVTGTTPGSPGTVTVTGTVLVTNEEGEVVNDATVNVNFSKWENGQWVYKNTKKASVVNGAYAVNDWTVGVGQWRVRAVLPTQGPYNGSASGYHEFEIVSNDIPTQTYLTLGAVVNGAPGHVSVSGNVLTNGGSPVSGFVNVNFQKLVGGSWETMSSDHPVLSNGYYEVNDWTVGVGQWRVRAVFPPGQGNYLGSESNYHEFTIQPVPTNTYLTVDQVVNGTPGRASVSGNVLTNGGSPVSGTVNVNFQKYISGSWQTQSTAVRTLSNGHYDVDDWGVGVGQWRVRAVFPEQGDYAQSESNYHYFDIQPVPTETYLTVDQIVNGTPGRASVSGNVLRTNGSPASGTVNVNFQKYISGSWQTQSTAVRTLSNGHYDVDDWGVGVGQWRVRAVFPEQGDYAYSESNYHYFDIQPVPTQAYLTVDRTLHGQPGYASVSGNVLRTNGSPASGTVNVNFQKYLSGSWQTQSTAVRTLSNGHYDVDDWGVGVGQWRVRVVFPAQGDYAYSESNYHYFDIKSGYRLIARHSNRCMSLSGNGGANGTAILQWDCSPNPVPWDGQVFTLVPMGGYFNLKINSTGKCVDVAGVSYADGAWLQQWDCLGAGQANQIWNKVPISGQPPYVAFIAKHSNKCADVAGASTGNGARLTQWSCHWGGNQQWTLQAVN